MEPQSYTPTYELFLVVERVRHCLADVVRSLAPIDRGALPEPLGSDIYYRRQTDVALLGLRFDERRIDHATLELLEQIAIGAGLPVLDPTRLAERDRRRFYASYLNSYEVQIENQPTAAWALAELGRQLGVTVPRPPRRRSGPTARLTPPEPMRLNPGDTEVPIFTGSPNTPTANTMADQLPPLPDRLRGRRLGSDPEPNVPAHQRLVTENDGGSEIDTALDQPGSGPVTRVEAAEALARMRPRRKRSSTTPATPLAKSESGRREAGGHTSAVPTPIVEPTDDAPAIDVRYLRGTEWLPARLRSLSMKGGYLVTGALPRSGDMVHIALGFRGTGAMIQGEVYHVTPVEDAPQAGACGFAVKFPKHDSTGRRQLITLLKHARDVGVTIKPPPSRTAVRFHVRWPIRVSTPRSGVEAAALDVSESGMFVRTTRELPSEAMLFRMPLDTDDTAVRGRARAVRRVNQQMALERGLQTGYGLLIEELSDVDKRRWQSFLERVRRRSEKRLLVGGSLGRVRALGDALLACGYAVQGASDAATLLNTLRSASRPPDAILLDPTLSASRSEFRQIEAALSTLSVPRVATDRELPSRARMSVDHLLQV